MTEPEAIAPITWEALLAQARALAAWLDPDHAAVYRHMPPSRWLQAVDLGAEVLTAHAAYRLHHARGRGRRQHAATMHQLLDSSNAVNVVAATTMLLVAGRLLDRSSRGD